jgi:hypothetical protein
MNQIMEERKKMIVYRACIVRGTRGGTLVNAGYTKLPHAERT